MALIVVLGAGVGCSRPNPGFGVAPVGTIGGVEESSAGEPTTMGPAPETTTGETTGGVVMWTTTGESTSTSTTTGGLESSEGSSSTGEPLVWPMDCDEPIETPAGVAVADTWFLNDFLSMDTKKCLGGDGECLYQALGAVPSFPVFYVGSGDPEGDFLGLFAARFAGLKPMYLGQEVPPEAFVGAVVTLRMARGTGNDVGWPDTKFDVYALPGEGEPWDEGDNEVMAKCGPGDASYGCKRCDVNMSEQWLCAEDWPDTYPFKPGVNKKLSEVLAASTNEEEDLVLRFDGALEKWEWLIGDGLLLVPNEMNLSFGWIDVRAKEFAGGAAGPFISVLHCPFEEP